MEIVLYLHLIVTTQDFFNMAFYALYLRVLCIILSEIFLLIKIQLQ